MKPNYTVKTKTLVDRLHEAICNEFHSTIDRILRVNDVLFEKKVAVFVLKHFYNYKSEQIAKAYGIYDLYFPVHIRELTDKYVRERQFQDCITRILNYCDGSEEVD